MSAIIFLGGLSLTLAIGGLLTEYILPRIPAIDRFLDRFEQ